LASVVLIVVGICSLYSLLAGFDSSTRLIRDVLLYAFGYPLGAALLQAIVAGVLWILS